MKIKHFIAIALLLISTCSQSQTDDMSRAAANFIKLLQPKQMAQAVYPFDTTERYIFGYVPKTDRKGLSVNEMNDQQKTAAFTLMKAALSKEAYAKARAVMQLELVLKALENRAADDHYRDTGKYFFTVFGKPGGKHVWGWRLDGHHLSFNFTSDTKKIVAGTPGFMGSNPAVVLSGPEKGKEILHDETRLGLSLVQSLSEKQLVAAMISANAPADILTTDKRVAVITDKKGISYADMTVEQQKALMQLLSLYIQRYTHLFATSMMEDIEKAGTKNLVFSWAGSMEDGPGHAKYYRIQGPTIVIEYDNTQNNGNHVHTVVRDLKNDFGGDVLLEHYRSGHTKN